MTDQYDWSKLDEGWKHNPEEYISTHEYAYWYHTGCVGPRIGCIDNPDAAYQFHVAAREQVAKCRVPDWEARCKELERECDLLRVERGSVRLRVAELESSDWSRLTEQKRLTEENEQLRAKLAAPDVDTGIWVCASLREDIWHSMKRCSYDDAVEWLGITNAAAANAFPVAAWNALVRSGRAR